MPTKRQILEILNRNELLALADLHELAVEDRRVREQLVDAAAGQPNSGLADDVSVTASDESPADPARTW
ncbi:MAG TPA: hypothetical protein VNO30_38855 [Kofleriaceae bacterium]|nr:hypothetical protein [Kofleriaceae bacterium]